MIGSILLTIYICIALLIGILDTIFILKNHNMMSWNMFKFIFMYQYAVYEQTKDELNVVGIIILEILTTAIVWFFNVVLFVLVCLSYIFDAICDLFDFLFSKR